MNFKEKFHYLKQCYWEIMDLIQKLGKINERSRENPEQLGCIIREKLKQAENELENLFIELEDEEDYEIKTKYIEICNKLKEDLKISRLDFRKALLKSNKNIHLTNQKMLKQLSGDIKEKTTLFQKRKNTTSSSTLNTSSNILSALAELHQLMESEMSRSSLTLQELELSSNTLQSLQENYLTFGTLLTKSRKLLSELEYANKFDRLLIICSLMFFLSVVGWIIYKRLLRRIIYAIIWLFFIKLRNVTRKIIKTYSM
ncbi:hypothetical protein PCK1_001523 [Pneumocystis canis]|nr:hypothetical protein PCK1_001523 [Pneumocystis canis]